MSNSTELRPVQSATSSQDAPDFGDLLDAYDLSTHGEDGKDQENGVTEGSKTPPNRVETRVGTCADQTDDHPPSSDFSDTENMNLPRATASGVPAGHGNLHLSKPSSPVLYRSQADTSTTVTPYADQVSSPGNPLTIDTCQESSLQTLSRFVEELSSPRPRVTVLGSPGGGSSNAKDADIAGSTTGNGGKTVDSNGASVSPPSSNNVNLGEAVVCKSPGSTVPSVAGSGSTILGTSSNKFVNRHKAAVVPTSVSTVGPCEMAGSTSLEADCGTVDSSREDREDVISQAVVSGEDRDVQDNRVIKETPSEDCVHPDSVDTSSVCATRDQSVNNSVCVNVNSDTEMPVSSSQKDKCSLTPVVDSEKQKAPLASLSDSCSQDEASSLSCDGTLVDSSSFRNSEILCASKSQQDTAPASSLPDSEKEAGSATETSESQPRPSSASSSNSTEVVSVLVTEGRLQTVHCLGGSQTEMLSFNIENVPDSSANEADPLVTETTVNNGGGGSHVSSSSSRDVDAVRIVEHVVSGASEGQFGSSDSVNTSASGRHGTGNASGKSGSVERNEVSSCSVSTSEQRERKTVAQMLDTTMQKKQKDVEVATRKVQDLFQETPVLLQCLGVDQPTGTSSSKTDTEASSSSREVDRAGSNRYNFIPDVSSSNSSSRSNGARVADSSEVTSQRKGQTGSTDQQGNKNGVTVSRAEPPYVITPVTTVSASGNTDQPFIVTPLNTNSGMDQPFVVTPVSEPVLSPGSVRSSNPSPVGSTCSNQTTHSPTVPTSTRQTNTGRENKRKRRNPTRSQNYSTTPEIPRQPSEEARPIAQQSIRNPEDVGTLSVQVKREKPDAESSCSAAAVQNVVPHITQDSLPRIANVQSLHPTLATNALQPAPRPKPPRVSKPRSKPSNREAHNIVPGPGPSYSANQNMYSASNLMSHLNDRANLRPIRPMTEYYPPINITPENAPPPRPPPHPPNQGYPPPYMPGGPMRMSLPYLPPPVRPLNFPNQANMPMDRPPAVHLERGALRVERPRMPMSRAGINMERHNMLQTTRQPFSSPFIDMGPQMGDVYYSQPQGLILPQQHHPPRAPLVIRPDSTPPLNLKKQLHPSPNDNIQSAVNRLPAPASQPQPSLNRNTFVPTEATPRTTKTNAVIFFPPKVIPAGSNTGLSNTTSLSKTVRIAPKKTPSVSTSSVVVKPSVSSSLSVSTSASSASKTASSDPDPTRISSDILKEQQVKTYRPQQPPEHLGFKDTLKTCKCQGCGDEFLFSSSLINHLDRKSVVIKYNCGECNKTIVFYNRCCLFIHAKGHAKGARAYRLNINLATINALPEEMLPTKLSLEEEKQKLKSHQADKLQENVESDAIVKSPAPTETTSQIVTQEKPASQSKPQPLTLSYNPNFSLCQKNGRYMYSCPECNKCFWNVAALQNHFIGKTTKTASYYKCSKCLTDVIGICASKAHMRIHSKEQPYVCPECGELITGNRDIFLKHLKQKCMHFQRTLLMRCKVCLSVLLSDAETVASHFNEQHSLKYYKCLECPMAFKTELTYKNHLESEHNGKGDHKLICKCPLCDTVFHQECNIESHFRFDHWPTLVRNCFTAYKCLSCVPKKVFNQKSAYVYHAAHVHNNPTVVDMCNECGEEFQSTDAMKIHRVKVHKDLANLVGNCDIDTEKVTESLKQSPAGSTRSSSDLELKRTSVSSSGTEQQSSKEEVICTKCDTKFISVETYKKHMEKHKFVEKRKLVGTRVPSVQVKKLKLQPSEKRKVELEKNCAIRSDPKPAEKLTENSTSPKPATEFIGQVPTAPTPKPRNKCSECPARFSGTEELQEHLKIAHGISPQYPCHLCGNTYESQILVERHIQVTHEGKSKDHPYLCWLCLDANVIKGYGSWKMLEKHLMNHHKLHKNNIDYSKFPKYVKEEGDTESVSSRRSSIELDDLPVKRLKVAGDSLFNCAKCSFQAETRGEFVQHIAKHRPDELSHQCLECGLCFAVLPSLKRHLFVVHKIRDFTKYQEESGCDVEQLNGDCSGTQSQTSPLKLHVSQIPNGIAQPNLDRLEKKKETKKVESAEEQTLECNVCYKTFETDAARRKHMRMHGMAFIRSRRAPVPTWE